MKIYGGGSENDELLFSLTGNSTISPITIPFNQMFIMFTTTSDDNGVAKGFTAIISFGNIITTIQFAALSHLSLEFFFKSGPYWSVALNLCKHLYL